MQQIIKILHDRDGRDPESLLSDWQQYLVEQDHAAGTIKMYLHAVHNFLTWYENAEQALLVLKGHQRD